ncbi:hypothetical protein [Paenibacillus sp. FSL A5-0031]|nr:hypothetical protein [Paenibacillus sp. FSL A5-0031]
MYLNLTVVVKTVRQLPYTTMSARVREKMVAKAVRLTRELDAPLHVRWHN